MPDLPPDITYGYVTDWVALAEGDGPDEGRDPDARYPDGLTVTLTPKMGTLAVTGPIPGRVFPQPVTCTIDPTTGYLTDSQGAQGVWLVTGQWQVSYKHPAVPALTFTIEVTAAHTDTAPLYLSDAQPPGGTPLSPSEYAELSARIDALTLEAAGVRTVNGEAGDVTLTAQDVGAVPADDPRLYNSGWRDMRSLLRPGWTADRFDLLRDGGMVHLRIANLTGDGTGGVSVADMRINGYRPPDFYNVNGSLFTDSQPTEVGKVTIELFQGSPRYLRASSATLTGGYGGISWPTVDAVALPAPGTPA